MNVDFIQPIKGDPKGKALFTITQVDVEDAEDTTVNLWRANDHDHLQELYIKEHTTEDDTPNDDYIVSQIEEDWGLIIIPQEIAIFK